MEEKVTMKGQVERLLDRIRDKFVETPEGCRLLIAIAGIPGSGKTTLAQILARKINTDKARFPPITPSEDVAKVLPMDGFHLTRAQLNAMPNPEHAHARRGAEFTFDGKGFYELVKELRKPVTAGPTVVWAPDFDHAVKDPVENIIKVSRDARIIIFEGNYLLLDQEPWSDAARLMDLKFFVRVTSHLATERLVNRHMAAGIARTKDEAVKRVEENDLVNGKMIEDLLKEEEVDEFVTSITGLLT